MRDETFLYICIHLNFSGNFLIKDRNKQERPISELLKTLFF